MTVLSHAADLKIRGSRKIIHILGASGSGTSTIGSYVAGQIGAAYLDTDDLTWLPTIPPFQEKTELSQRLKKIEEKLDFSSRVVISGSVMGWGRCIEDLFEVAIFLTARTEVRLRRIRKRERILFGTEALKKGGEMHLQHTKFLSWAADYENGTDIGRCRSRHEEWLQTLNCPVLRFDSEQELTTLSKKIVNDLSKRCAIQSADKEL